MTLFSLIFSSGDGNSVSQYGPRGHPVLRGALMAFFDVREGEAGAHQGFSFFAPSFPTERATTRPSREARSRCSECLANAWPTRASADDHRPRAPPERTPLGKRNDARLSETSIRPQLFEPGWSRSSAPSAREAITHSRLPKLRRSLASTCDPERALTWPEGAARGRSRRPRSPRSLPRSD